MCIFQKKKNISEGKWYSSNMSVFCQNHLVQMISGKKIKCFVWHVEWRWSNSCGRINSQVISQLIRTHVIDTHLSPFQKKNVCLLGGAMHRQLTPKSQQRNPQHTHTHTHPTHNQSIIVYIHACTSSVHSLI